MADSVKYLRLDMGNSRKCFVAYKRGRVALAERMANMTFSVVYRLCDRENILEECSAAEDSKC